MVVLTGKQGQKLVIGDVTLTVVEVSGGRVRLALDAPAWVRTPRAEPPGPPDGPAAEAEAADSDRGVSSSGEGGRRGEDGGGL
jgi:carbon storage regulator